MKLLKFETSHCPMCKAMDSMLRSLDVEVEHVDAESDGGCLQAEYFNVKNVPMLIKLDDDGYEQGRIGYTTLNKLEAFLEE